MKTFSIFWDQDAINQLPLLFLVYVYKEWLIFITICKQDSAVL